MAEESTRDQILRLVDARQEQVNRAVAAETRVKELEAALRHYGRHTACAAGHIWIWSESDLAVCDCGLADVLRGSNG